MIARQDVSIKMYPLNGMMIKHYLWNCTYPERVKNYYYDNIDFSLSREQNLQNVEEYAKSNDWPSNDLKACRRLIIRAFRIVEGKELRKKERRAFI